MSGVAFVVTLPHLAALVLWLLAALTAAGWSFLPGRRP